MIVWISGTMLCFRGNVGGLTCLCLFCYVQLLFKSPEKKPMAAITVNTGQMADDFRVLVHGLSAVHVFKGTHWIVFTSPT
jgi:hypothetical protein